MSATIFYIIIALLMIVMSSTWIPWRRLFEKLYGNNPLKGKVYIEAGEQISVCNGNYAGSVLGKNAGGLLYYYKYEGLRATVFVPFTYPYRYVFGRRQIRVIWGQSNAAPLGGMSEAKLGISGDMLDDILRARIGSELVKSIFGKSVKWMTILLLVGALVIASVFMYNNFIKTPDIVPVNTPDQTSPPAQTSGDWPEG